LSGPVVEEPRWWIGLVCALAGGVVFVLAGGVAGGWGMRTIAIRALFGVLVAGMAAAEIRHLLMANRDVYEWAVTGVATAVAVVTATVVAAHVARWSAGSAGETACAPMVDALRVRSVVARRARVNGALQAFWLVAITIVNLLLVYDARYRDFPSLLVAPVIVAYLALALARGRTARAPREIEERFLAGALVVGAAAIVVLELPINGSADLWALLCVSFAGATWINAAQPPSSVASAVA
jgi:glucan 1,3-beta-glucosidase